MYTYICINMYIYTYIYIYMYMCIHIYIYISVYMSTRMFIHIHLRTQLYAYITQDKAKKQLHVFLCNLLVRVRAKDIDRARVANKYNSSHQVFPIYIKRSMYLSQIHRCIQWIIQVYINVHICIWNEMLVCCKTIYVKINTRVSK